MSKKREPSVGLGHEAETSAAALKHIVETTLQLPDIDEYMRASRELAALTRQQSAGGDLTRLPSTQRLTNSSERSLAIASARDLGRVIQAERKKRNLSQQAFADLIGVGRRFISELENGKPTLEFDKVLQVTSAVGIDLVLRPR